MGNLRLHRELRRNRNSIHVGWNGDWILKIILMNVSQKNGEVDVELLMKAPDDIEIFRTEIISKELCTKLDYPYPLEAYPDGN